MGLAAAAVVFAVIASIAWRFSHPAPPPINGSRPVLPTQLPPKP